MPKGRERAYDTEYKRMAFNLWCLNGRPEIPRLVELMPIYEPLNRKPSNMEVRRWRIEDGWDIKADEVDAQAEIRVMDDLVTTKAELLQRQFQQATVVANLALDYIISGGFDSSASAVNAFFRGIEEQRKVKGFSDLLERLDKMTNNEVQNQIIGLLTRAASNDQIVDGDITTPKEDDSADPSE